MSILLQTKYIYTIQRQKEKLKDVKGCATFLNHIISTNNLLSGIIKEDVDVLYNNVSNCDIISLYKEALDFFDCKSITFTTIEDIISELKNNTKIVYYDGETYTSFSLKKKGNNIDEFPSDSILVGRDSEGKHYSRKDIVWELYKSRFTK